MCLKLNSAVSKLIYFWLFASVAHDKVQEEKDIDAKVTLRERPECDGQAAEICTGCWAHLSSGELYHSVHIHLRGGAPTQVLVHDPDISATEWVAVRASSNFLNMGINGCCIVHAPLEVRFMMYISAILVSHGAAF